jgi:hypothetical protein
MEDVIKKTRPKAVNCGGLFGQPPILVGEDAAAYEGVFTQQ